MLFRTDDFNNKMNASNNVFELVKPVLEHYFGGTVCSVECQNNDACRLLDICGGIDALVYSNSTLFGIAHRVKFNDYSDFTIRIRNVYGTRSEIDHIRQSGMKPRYHVQTVCIDNKPTKIAIAKTSDIVHAIDTGLASYKTAYNGAKFAILRWSDMKNAGINVDIIDYPKHIYDECNDW